MRWSSARCSQQTGQHEAALPLAEEAAVIYRSLADRQRRGRRPRPDRHGARAVPHVPVRRSPISTRRGSCTARGGRPARRGHTLSHSGIACWHLGRYPEALSHLARRLPLYREVGDRRGEAKTLNNLGRMQLYYGYHRDALDAYQDRWRYSAR